jgi:hypothetical protein
MMYKEEIDLYGEYRADPFTSCINTFKAVSSKPIKAMLARCEYRPIREAFTAIASSMVDHILEQIKTDVDVENFYRNFDYENWQKKALDAPETKDKELQKMCKEEKERAAMTYWVSYWDTFAKSLIETEIMSLAATFPTEKEYKLKICSTTIQRIARGYIVRKVRTRLAAKKAAATTAASSSVGTNKVDERTTNKSWAYDSDNSDDEL